MSVTPPRLHRLAYYYFDQDWDLEAPTPDGVVANFARNEGRAAVEDLVAEVIDVLVEGRSEAQLQEWWIHELRSQFEPNKIDMTYREWFEHIVEVLRAASPPASP